MDNTEKSDQTNTVSKDDHALFLSQQELLVDRGKQHAVDSGFSTARSHHSRSPRERVNNYMTNGTES